MARPRLEIALVKLVYRPVGRWAAGRALRGRYLDRDDPSRGRFTRQQVKRVMARTWDNYDALAPGARVGRLETRGARHNVLLGVFSLATHRALLTEGVDRAYATELVTDLAWQVYERWISVPRLVARAAGGDPQERMNLMLRMFLRFPFGRPGYEWRARSEPGAFAIDFHRCPVSDYLSSQAEEEFMRDSWCTLDFALAQAMTEGGHYKRPHTLSAGDPVCDMRWCAAKPRATGG